MRIQYQQIIVLVRPTIICASNAASSNCASLNVEKVAVRPCMFAMKRCWLTMMSKTSPYLACRAKSNANSDSRQTASSGSFRRKRPETIGYTLKQAKIRSPVSIASRMAARIKSIAVVIGCDQKDAIPIAKRTFALVGDEAVLLDQVKCELGETKTLIVTVKDRADA